MRLRGRPPSQTPRESVVPLINVVFLLLVFFMMTAAIAPPEPLDVLLPGADTAPEQAAQSPALYLAADGTTAFGGLRGAEALAAAAAAPAPLDIRADRDLEARVLAEVLRALREFGAVETRLISVRQ